MSAIANALGLPFDEQSGEIGQMGQHHASKDAMLDRASELVAELSMILVRLRTGFHGTVTGLTVEPRASEAVEREREQPTAPARSASPASARH